MKPVEFEGQTGKLVAPEGMDDCDALPMMKTEDGFVSMWELDHEELEGILRSKHVVLTVFGNGHPPVKLGVQEPTKADGHEPEAVFELILRLRSEIESLKEIDESWTGCGTGDCPHNTGQECLDAQIKTNVGLMRRLGGELQ